MSHLTQVLSLTFHHTITLFIPCVFVGPLLCFVTPYLLETIAHIKTWTNAGYALWSEILHLVTYLIYMLIYLVNFSV